MWWKILIAALKRLLGIAEKEQAQQATDTAATTRNEDAEHAVQRVEARPPLSPSAVSSRMRDGTF